MRGSLAIAIAGASCSGKTTLADFLADVFSAPVLRVDNYYRPLDDLTYEQRCGRNFDHPDAIDHARLVSDLQALLSGVTVEAPRYNFCEHTLFAETMRIEPASVVLVEGLFALCYPEIVARCAIRIFVDAPEEVCLERRMNRDIRERGRDAVEVNERFRDHVWPMYLKHIEPTRAVATHESDGCAAVGLALEAIMPWLPASLQSSM